MPETERFCLSISSPRCTRCRCIWITASRPGSLMYLLRGCSNTPSRSICTAGAEPCCHDPGACVRAANAAQARLRVA